MSSRSICWRSRWRARQPRHSGFSLPELMVSLTIGLVLLAAFLVILDRCRREFATNESLGQLQDAARQVTALLVSDLEHAGFYGVTSNPLARVVHGGVVMAEADALRQPDAAHAVPSVPGLPAGSHDCGVNFAIDLALAVQGSNGAWPAHASSRSCAPTSTAGGARAGSDTLTLRHASLEPSAPRSGRLQLYARLRESHGMVFLFGDGRAPGPLDEQGEVRDVEIHFYYIANNSVGRPGWPALRVKSLTESRGAAQFRDEEVMPGVEDLQVEIGVADDSDGSGRMQFVAPDAPGIRDGHIVAVRLWLRLRADSTERGYRETRALQYADVSFAPDATAATQRRLLLERTVALRNLRHP